MDIAIDASRAAAPKWGGQENYAYYLIHAMSRLESNHDYTLYTSIEPTRPFPLTDNITTRLIPFPRMWTQVRLAIQTYLTSHDVLFFPVHTIPYLKRPGLKTVVTIHDIAFEHYPQYFRFPGRLYLRHYMRFSAKHATHLIAVSEATKQDVMKVYGISEERITVVHEAYDPEIFRVMPEEEVTPVIEKYDIQNPYLFFVSTIQPRKNIVRLIEAFSRLPEFGINSPVELVLAGKPGWHNDEIYAAPEKYGVADRVKFLGHIPDADLTPLMNGARALVYPSLYEGFGLEIPEAMACGTPVITSNISSMPEIAGDAALLIDPYDVNGLASACASVLADDEVYQQLREKGFQRAQEFTWDKAARETVAVLERVASKQ